MNAVLERYPIAKRQDLHEPVKEGEHPLDVATKILVAGDREGSLKILKQLEMEDQNDVRVKFNLGWHYASQGDWKTASSYLDCGRFLNCFGSPPLPGVPIWNDEPLKDKNLHLRMEGGFGDEIVCVRFAENFAALGAKVTVSCSAAIRSLFARMPAVCAVVSAQAAEHVHADYWVPAMSAMRWFEPWHAPYLEANPEHVRQMSNIVRGRDLKIGLRWSGSPAFEHQQHRKFPPNLMTDLAASFPEAQFFSLQRDNDLVDLPPEIVDLKDFIPTWEHTAAAIERLDLVLSSCTSVAHLAAAMGKETWVVAPILPYYPWAQPGTASVWYDSVTVFRQAKYGEWEAPFEEIRQALKIRATE